MSTPATPETGGHVPEADFGNIQQGECNVRQREDLLRENEELRERVAILQSQVDNADVNLEQVRMAMKSNHKREMETALTAERAKVAQTHPLVLENGELRTKLRNSKDENGRLHDFLNNKVERIEELEKERDAMQKEIEEKMEAIQDAAKLIEKFKAEARAARQEVAKLEEVRKQSSGSGHFYDYETP
jgi:chromosome segregation ATPase